MSTEFFRKKKAPEPDPFVDSAIQFLNDTIRAFTPKKILLVDDDPVEVELICRQLNKFYCDYTVCHDAEEAEVLMRNLIYDFVFIDQRMPKLTGYDLIKKMEPEGPRSGPTSYILITGQPLLLNDCLNLGHLLMPKPIDETKLKSLNLRPRPRPVSPTQEADSP
jgi:CheY-like chemotaxis protein